MVCVVLQVLVARYGGGSQLRLEGASVVRLEQHERCACRCRAAGDCGPRQRASACGCVCRAPPAPCGPGRSWDPDECVCACRRPRDCSTGAAFDADTCR